MKPKPIKVPKEFGRKTHSVTFGNDIYISYFEHGVRIKGRRQGQVYMDREDFRSMMEWFLWNERSNKMLKEL